MQKVSALPPAVFLRLQVPVPVPVQVLLVPVQVLLVLVREAVRNCRQTNFVGQARGLPYLRPRL
ncbi:MAG: hypothetical protein ACK6EB_39370 [Planctomyces sp.]